MLIELNDGTAIGMAMSPTGAVLELHQPGQGMRGVILTPDQMVRLAGLLVCAHCGGVDVVGALKATEAFAAEWKRKVRR